ncbi:MAG: hypothetical protein KIH10_07050 [Candidatus Freyarchaeota archaeon]|nr:hypothetical protein [Candidatus Jordarchaeia archaeon]
MENPIKNVIVADTNGLCLVSAAGESTDDYLLSGLLTAILKLGEEMVESELESLVFKDQQIYYLKRGGCLTIAQVSRELPEAIVFRILSEITDSFLKKYGYLLKNWSGNLDLFSDFGNELKKYLNRPLLDSFMSSFWLQIKAEGVILYNTKKEETIFSSLPEGLESRKNRAVGGMLFTFANKISEDFRGGAVEVIVLRGKNKWIVNAVKGEFSLLCIFNREETHNLELIVEITKDIMESVVEYLII